MSLSAGQPLQHRTLSLRLPRPAARKRRSLPSGRLGAYLTTSRREVPPEGRSAEATRAKPSPSLRRSEEKAQKSAIRQTRSVIDHFSKRSGVLAPYLTIGRSNTGRSRSDCRGQRRISDLKDQIAKRRGGRRPVYGSTGRQGQLGCTVTSEAKYPLV